MSDSKEAPEPAELRRRALAAFDAEVVSLAAALDTAVKLAHRAIDALKTEAFDGMGYKNQGVSEGWLAKFEKAGRLLGNVVEADAKYHKSAKERSKKMTRDETKEVVRRFLFGELPSQERADFIKALAREHAERFQTITGASILTSKALTEMPAEAPSVEVPAQAP